ncbi:unannotated protein [freshwater metagenome]|uniref:Unannotated protein n=1 Tax=freshwater metagenome TaxID=449393 RepID=A0A6J7IXR7_9ZZZZ
MPECAADTVAARSTRSDQKSDAWSPPQSIPVACWPVHPERPKRTPSPGCAFCSARRMERR